MYVCFLKPAKEIFGFFLFTLRINFQSKEFLSAWRLAQPLNRLEAFYQNLYEKKIYLFIN